jgi:hypothetical protein
LPDLIYIPARPRAELLEAIRHRGANLQPALRILAEELLGAGSTIDLVAVDAEGGLVLVLIGESGEDLELFTLGIAQRAWVTARVRDWLQLAPTLAIRPEAPVKLSLLAPFFRPETVAAAGTLGPGTVELSTYRWIQNGAAAGVLIEPLATPEERAPGMRGQRASEPEPISASLITEPTSGPEPELEAVLEAETGTQPRSPAGTPARAEANASTAPFRTGLTEEDLFLTIQETREFE